MPRSRGGKAEAEGGCGVIGFASTVPVAGRHLFASCRQMRNRGNGKGGGIAAAGLSADALRVAPELLENDTILQIAYLDPSCRKEVEERFVRPAFEIDAEYELETLDDHRTIEGLDQRPPPVRRYFARVRPEALDRFIDSKGLRDLERWRAEEEFVWRNSYELNHAFYASLGEKRAFVLSHSKDLLVLKIVGFAEDVVRFYKLDDFPAHVWIGHQRYPTKGRVWHPGGAHPFIGVHDALVHNGDFANHHRVTKSLLQRNISPQFLTDTEVGVLLFDLYTRVYGYPLEYAIEAMAPTVEFDFSRLPAEKQTVYAALQAAHSKSAPDGPWFFIIARSLARERKLQLLGITDTAMLRPQVFALASREGRSIGLIASEKQAIDACLKSLEADGLFSYPADKYWNARGGSHSDGGAFAFTIDPRTKTIEATDKFGRRIEAGAMEFATARAFRREKDFETELLPKAAARLRFGDGVPPPPGPDAPLAIDASDFPPQGPGTLSIVLARAAALGWRRIALYRCQGQRFIACGLGPGSNCRVDVYGSPGDYLGSGLDGAHVHVHASAQDQAGQILKSGRLVIHGDVGQAFLYGAKGGEVYVMGSAAGRPLINAVGRPRVVINGACLDYLAESFMAGDPLKGGGFVVLNGIRITGPDAFAELETPYPGANLFSLASGGAIYVRDPDRRVFAEQLNGGRFDEMTAADWALIRPYLEENERHFGVSVGALLTHRGEALPPERIYRKVAPSKIRALIAHD